MDVRGLTEVGHFGGSQGAGGAVGVAMSFRTETRISDRKYQARYGYGGEIVGASEEPKIESFRSVSRKCVWFLCG